MFLRMKIFSRLRVPETKFLCRKSSSDAETKKQYQLFFDETVQNLLHKITRPDYNKIFRPKSTGEGWRTPVYKLMTTEELEQEMIAIKEKAKKLLQIPPYVEERKEINEVLSVNPELDGHDIDHAKFVFTDISFNVNNQERTIVVREPNGVLREAYWSERDRLNQIYNPTRGRELLVPKMFEDENLEKVLEKEEYEFILDRACAQFEPDDPLYHKVIKVTYEKINEKSQFEVLISTRHFGSLAFYLLLNKKIDNMLLHFISLKRIDDAYSLVKLYHIIHPDCSSAKSSKEEDDMKTLEQFIKSDSNKKDVLWLALQSYKQTEKEREIVEKGIQEAHGFK